MHDSTAPKPLREERRPARDSVDEIAPGLLRLQLPISMPGLGHVNCYAMEDDRGVALVDPGLPGPSTWRQLKRRLSNAGLPVERVHTVVVTHSHPDHFGQAERFRDRYGAEIITHESFRTFLDPGAEADDHDVYTVLDPNDDDPKNDDGAAGDPADEQHTDLPATVGAMSGSPFSRATPWGGQPFQLPLTRRVQYWAMRRAAGMFMSSPTPTRRVDEAEVIELGKREWVSVHTPGHTQDHLCLWDPANGIMISGDHVLPTITPHISGMGVTADPLADFMRSLDRMRTFGGVTKVLPAHGLEFDDLHGRATDIKVHHHERLDTLREAGDRLGRATVQEYMEALFQQRSWGSMAESETYAHLEHLRLHGEAAVTNAGAQLHYEILDAAGR